MTNQIMMTLKNKTTGSSFSGSVMPTIRNSACKVIAVIAAVVALLGVSSVTAQSVAMDRDGLTVHIEQFKWKSQKGQINKRKAFIRSGFVRTSGSYHGLKTGLYVVNYIDGKTVPVYIRNVINCGNWQPSKGRVSSVFDSTYLIDSRYVWMGQEVNGQKTCLYQYEWVNSRPEVQIKNIEFSSMSTVATPYLFALTVRKPKAAPVR